VDVGVFAVIVEAQCRVRGIAIARWRDWKVVQRQLTTLLSGFDAG
jgi:hypothetical protein